MRCILYPETHIVLTAPVKKQSREFVQKAKELCRASPNLLNEIEGGFDGIKAGLNESGIYFSNGSWIESKTYAETARGSRANILIVDEYAMLKDKKLLLSTFIPMLSNPRSPLYSELKLSERKKFAEPTRQVLLSSIRTDFEWSWEELVKYINKMTDGDKNYGAICLPYQFGVKAGYIEENRVRQTFLDNEESREMLRAEYEAIPISGGTDTFFKYQDLNSCRNQLKVLVAKSDEEYIEYKNKPEKWEYYIPKLDGEIRILSMDVALIESAKNDNTSFWITRCIPNGDNYFKAVSYAETLHGLNSMVQGLRLKQLFYEFECDLVGIDAIGAGMGVVDYCMKETYDERRGVTYPAWTVVNSDDIKTANRVLSENAVPVMYAIKTSSFDKHKLFTNAREMISTSDLHLPVDDGEALEYYLKEHKYFNIDNNDLKNRLMNTYVQTNMLIYEAINLETIITNGFYNLKEKPSRRKDRVMSLCYNLGIVKEKEEEYILSQQDNSSSFLDFLYIV